MERPKEDPRSPDGTTAYPSITAPGQQSQQAQQPQQLFNPHAALDQLDSTTRTPQNILTPPTSSAPGTGTFDTFEEVSEVDWQDGRASMVSPQATGQFIIAPQPTGKSTASSTNPFLQRKEVQQGESFGGVSSTPPTLQPMPQLSNNLDQKSIGDTSNNPWAPAIDDPGNTNRSSLSQQPPLLAEGSAGSFDSTPSQQASVPPHGSQSLVSLPSGDSTAWEDEKTVAPKPDDSIFDTWDDVGSSPAKGKEANSSPPDDWDLLTNDLSSSSSQQKPSLPPPSTMVESIHEVPQAEGSHTPDLPPRPASAQPRRMADEALGSTSTTSVTNPPPPRSPRPKGPETYYIKKIRWLDSRVSGEPDRMRVTPILVQNKNGPCPLLALVNTLTLTAPRHGHSDLIEALRAREQITLDTLLHHVLNELFAEHRMQTEATIPDPVAYMEFLRNLHTGMVVNPRFFPAPEMEAAFKRSSLSHIHPTERDGAIPGTFEQSKEMDMYAKFDIPLMHGWLPSTGSQEYDALKRQAASYEDATILVSRQDELEAKLDTGLSEEEQQSYIDSFVVRDFILHDASTQLTEHGIEVLRRALGLGGFAILFRNEHFSTLYRHPRTEELFTLVTDVGMASHEEVVWESLVDTAGRGTELFSGDFRMVGGPGGCGDGGGGGRRDGGGVLSPRPQMQGPPRIHSTLDFPTLGAPEGGLGVTPPPRSSSAAAIPASPSNVEQEDADLAFALQLQEEEEEALRKERDRRMRESRLSERFIEQQGGAGGTVGRGMGAGVGGMSSQHPTGMQPTPMGRGQSGQGRGIAVEALEMGYSHPAGGRNPSFGQPQTGRPTGNGGVAVPVTHGRHPGATAQGGVRPQVLGPPRTPAVHRPGASGPAGTGGAGIGGAAGRGAAGGAAAEDLPPPSYETAARQQAFSPPQGHPAHPASAPVPGGGQQEGVPAAVGGQVGQGRVSVGGMGVRVNGAGGRRTSGATAARVQGQAGQGHGQAQGQGRGREQGKGDCNVM